ncbi:AsmA-like C-terminal region-containing protein [Pontiella sp.]|uniref:AsmA-like C-terminal region-containing protein n=1 Tax=Pontiella sp. TaxID=2837462 RepID=UPI00356232AC
MGGSCQRFAQRTFKTCRVCVRIFSVVVFLLIFLFVFLRTYGVPGFVLKEVVRQVNSKGIPVDVERVRLTLRGWRAENMRYYSKHPDDLEPMFFAQNVLFERLILFDEAESGDWVFEVEADSIAIAPSVEWGVDIPEASPFRTVEGVRLTLGFHDGRVRLSDGELSWIGGRFKVDGTVLTQAPPQKEAVVRPPEPAPKETAPPVWISREQFVAFENHLKAFKVNGAAEVALEFVVDSGNLAASHLSLDARAVDIVYRGVGFSGLELKGEFRYPAIDAQRIELRLDNRSLVVAGRYDFASGLVEGTMENTIVSTQPLLLLPQPVLDVLVKAQLQFESLPCFSLAFGPAKPKGLLNAVGGSFLVEEVNYRELEIDRLEGNLTRRNDRLDLTALSGTVLGQREKAEQYGSCMQGGSATGSVFWDAAANEFGVSATGSFDPNLLIRPLDMVPIATNVIDRFKFADRPPQISLELGSNLADWSTFYIDVQAMANDAAIHGVRFSSVNTFAAYKNKVLRLDPIAAMQGVDFLKGSTSIDFGNHTVAFDAFGSMPPAVIEDVAYPGFEVFGNKILCGGNTQIRARGKLDWKTMRATDFSAEVEADVLEIPVARLERFKATVMGKGPRILVKNAGFNLYGGEGSGTFSIQLDPATNTMPYTLETRLGGVDFRSFLSYLRPEVEYTVSGNLKANAAISADMKRGFFEAANGKGRVEVKDGQLADLRFFSGFSRLMRNVFSSFSVFSITKLSGGFELKNGVVSSDDAYFSGDFMNAKAKGTYSNRTGFDVLLHTQVFSD